MVPKKIIVLVIVSVILVIGISSLIYYNIIQFLNSNRWAAQTYQVLNQLEIVYSDVKDIEADARGFIVTGNELYVGAYNNMSKVLKPELVLLRHFVTIDNSPIQTLNNLEDLINEQLTLRGNQINERRSSTFNPAKALISEEISKSKMDEIRNSVNGMMSAENNLLTDRLKDRASRTFGLFAITTLLIIILIGTIISTIFLFKKELGSRRKVHDQLQEGLNYSNMIIDTVYTPLLVLDGSLNIVNENRAFYENFNYAKEELTNKPFFDMIKGKFDYNDLTNRLRSIIPDNTSFVNYELELADNRIISMNARKLYRNINNVHLILVGLEDITARKQAEERLKLTLIELEHMHKKTKKYAEELEELNETKDKLFSLIAHDLRSPFQVLTSASNLLIDDIDSFNKEEIQQIAGELRTTVKTQHEVVDNLLTWVHLQRGKIEANPRRVFLYDKIKIVTEQLKMYSHNKNVQITNLVPVDCVAIGDMVMLQIIFQNLIYNAIKYCNPGGTIELNAKKTETEITIWVRDNGIGMDEDLKKLIFTIDSHVKRPGTQNEKGTGLGLNLSREMVIKQGGKIWAESEKGKGSTFYFTLPAADGSEDI